jgi:hypothetical protein
MSASGFYRKYPLHYARAEKGRGPRPRKGLWKGRGVDIRPARFPLTGEGRGPRGEARRALSCSGRRGTCEVLILEDRYDPFAVLPMVEGWGGAGRRADRL